MACFVGVKRKQNPTHGVISLAPSLSIIKERQRNAAAANASKWTKNSTLHPAATCVPPVEIINMISEFLPTCYDYVNWISTNRAWRQSRYSMEIKRNFIFEQIPALHAIFKERANVLITGSAGTGKSVFINLIKKYADKLHKRIMPCGMTAMACLQVEGARTLHSFSGIGLGNVSYRDMANLIDENRKIQEEQYNRSYRNNSIGINKPLRKYKQWQEYDILLIDEVSMLGAGLMQKVDLIAKNGRTQVSRVPAIFGGIQVIFVGDVFQIPPVNDAYFFQSPLFPQFRFQSFELTHMHRQASDLTYAYMLSRIRVGECIPRDIELLKSRVGLYKESEFVGDGQVIIRPPFLLPLQKNVKATNQRYFYENKNNIVTNHRAEDMVVEYVTQHDTHEKSMAQHGTVTVVEALEKIGEHIDCRVPLLLEFKDKAQYILTFNYSLADGLVNGSTCVFHADTHTLHFKNGKQLPLAFTTHSTNFPVSGMRNTFLRRTQYHLRLGYALSIDSSQGVSLEEAIIDLGPSVRRAGQAYVALSRVRTLLGVYLLDFHEGSIKVNDLVRTFSTSTIHHRYPQTGQA